MLKRIQSVLVPTYIFRQKYVRASTYLLTPRVCSPKFFEFKAKYCFLCKIFTWGWLGYIGDWQQLIKDECATNLLH